MSSLEVLCLSVLGEFADRLDPNIFSGIPRHLLMEISKYLNPFDLQRLENGQVFEKAGISTESLWKERYYCRWNPRPSIKKAGYNKMHIPEDMLRKECGDCDSWRAAYLQRHLQVVLNERQYLTEDLSWGHCDLREVYLSPLLNRMAYQRIWSLENTLNNCSRYATYLVLSNRACIYLVENPSILLRFAEHVKFLRVNFVQKSGIDSVCALLETLTSHNLIGLELCMCRHVDPQSWSNTFNTRLLDSKCKQHSSCQQWPVIRNESLSSTCSYEGFLQACDTSSDTGHLPVHSPCTSSRMSAAQDGGSTFTCKDCTSSYTCPSSEKTESSMYRDMHMEQPTSYQGCLATVSEVRECLPSASSQVICAQHDRDSTFTSRAHPISYCVDTCLSSNETELSQCGLDKQADNDNLDIQLYDFDADKEMHAGHIPSQSRMPESSPCLYEQSVSDLYDEVFTCASVAEGTAHATVFTSALDTLTSGRTNQCENENAQVLYTMETVQKPYNMYAGLADTFGPLSCLRHLEYSADDPVGNSIPLLLILLENCHNLESLVVVFSQSCKGHGALFSAILELCLKGKLRHVELHDLYALPTGVFIETFVKILCQVVGVYCTVCQLDAPASLKSLHLLGSPHISAEVVCHFAKRLTNVCSCLGKEESSETQAQVSGSAQERKVHKADNVLVSEDSAERRAEGPARKHNTGRSDSQGEEIQAALTERCPSQGVETAATRFTGLQELQLSGWQIGDEGAKYIAASLERNGTLVCLALAWCGINTPGMSTIFRAVAGSRTLKTLNLSMNCYSPVADSSLATMLRTSQGLSELDMSHCFSHEGLTQEVVFSLCQNSSLKCLKLNGIRLGDYGMEMLAEVFRKPETISRITRLELSSNLITSCSVMNLVTALHSFKPRKLEELILAQNCFGASINKARTCLQSVVDSVYVSNEDNALACADYVSQM